MATTRVTYDEFVSMFGLTWVKDHVIRVDEEELTMLRLSGKVRTGIPGVPGFDVSPFAMYEGKYIWLEAAPWRHTSGLVRNPS